MYLTLRTNLNLVAFDSHTGQGGSRSRCLRGTSLVTQPSVHETTNLSRTTGSQHSSEDPGGGLCPGAVPTPPATQNQVSQCLPDRGLTISFWDHPKGPQKATPVRMRGHLSPYGPGFLQLGSAHRRFQAIWKRR